MVRIVAQDYGSLAFTALASTVFMFISVEGGQYFFGAVVGILLILLGIVGSTAFHLNRDLPQPDTEEEFNEAAFIIIALLLFIAFSYIVPQINFSPGQATYQAFFGQISFSTGGFVTANGFQIPAWVPVWLFIGIFIPVAEEQFFRGFWGNLAISALGAVEGISYVIAGFLGAGAAVLVATVLAALPAGALFGLFHAPAYNGSLPILIILALDGTVMVALDSITGRLFVSILAHVLNNSLSFFLAQSSVLSTVFPPWHGFGMLITPLLHMAPFIGPIAMLTFLLATRHRSRLGGFISKVCARRLA